MNSRRILFQALCSFVHTNLSYIYYIYMLTAKFAGSRETKSFQTQLTPRVQILCDDILYLLYLDNDGLGVI